MRSVAGHGSGASTREVRDRPGFPWVVLALGPAIVATASGAALSVLSFEPNTDYIHIEPWLVDLGGGRFAAEFVTYGRSASAVRYGVLAAGGNWIVSPRPVTPTYGYFLYPITAYAVSDGTGRIHVVWNLIDSDRALESFHYLQLDSEAHLRVSVGPVGAASVTQNFGVRPQTPGITVTTDQVHVYWNSNGTGLKAVLDMEGRVLVPAAPTAPGDNATAPPPRESNPALGILNAEASVIRDTSGGTYYLWVSSSFGGSPRFPASEYNLAFARTGTGGSDSAVLYSTLDSWWLSKPSVFAGIALAAGGTPAVGFFGIFTARWVSRRRRPR